MKRFRNSIVIIAITLLTSALFVIGAEAVRAQVVDQNLDVGLQEAQGVGLGTTNLRTTIVQFVRSALGFLGIVAVVVVLYGGYLYITAAGVPEKVLKAKRILVQAGVGTVIILTSYTIVSFVIGSILTAQQGGPGGTTTPPGGGGGGGTTPYANCAQLDPDPSSPAPYICGIAPNEAQEDTTITIVGRKFGTFNPATSSVAFELGGSRYQATVATCGEGAQPQWSDSLIRVRVPQGMPYDDAALNLFTVVVTNAQGDTREKILSSGPAGSTSDFTLLGGSAVVPDISCITPENVSAGTSVQVEGRRFGDDQGGSTLVFTDSVSASPSGWSDVLVTTVIPDGARTGYVVMTTLDGTSNGYWYEVAQPAAGLGEGCNLSADPNICIPGTCAPGLECNATLGCTCQFPSGAGLPTAGQSCDADPDTAQCEPGTCAAGNYCDVTTCTCAEFPEITELGPDNGAPGNFITITGKGFGTSGTVIFMGSAPGNGVHDAGEYWSDLNKDGLYTAGEPFLDLGAEALVAATPTGCAATSLWTAGQVIVEVPEGAADGPIAIINNNYYFDTTEENILGEYVSSFDVNEVTRPGLCGLLPTEGSFGTPVTFVGKNFSAAPGSVRIGGVEFANKPQWIWTSTQVANAAVPNISPATLTAQVIVGTENSNPVLFKVVPSQTGPHIASISPSAGPVGQYITIIGSRFGTTPGFVRFEDEAQPNPYNWHLADVDFPEQCDTTYWTNDAITVKVPSALQGTSGSSIGILVERPFAGSPEGELSNQVDFSYCQLGDAGCELTPGICKIEPSQAPQGTKGITIFGERLGEFLAGTSSVRFWENSFAFDLDASTWSSNKIGTGVFGFGAITVPDTASTGPVSVTTGTGVQSNQLLFEVGSCLTQSNPDGYCAERRAGTICCVADGICKPADECGVSVAAQCTYQWDFVTGFDVAGAGIPQVVEDRQCTNNLQSPSPWKNSTDACINAAIVARFTHTMIPSSINAQTVLIENCGSSDTFNPANCSASSIAISQAELLQDGQALKVTPAQPFNGKTWYQVRLISGSNGIKSVEGIWLDGDGDGIPGGDYLWHFRTRPGTQSCDLSKVVVYPQDAVIETLLDAQDYEAYAVAQNCNLLTGESFDWDWSIELSDRTPTAPGSPVIASITRNDVLGGVCSDGTSATYEQCTVKGALWVTDGNVDPEQIASPISQGRVFVVAEPRQNGSLNIRDDDNELIVDLKQPEIYSIYPDNHAITDDVDGYVMISGKNFGDDPSLGSVYFGDAQAQLAECAQSWSDDHILVKVPKAQDIASERYVAYTDSQAPRVVSETELSLDFEGTLTSVAVDNSVNTLTGDVKGTTARIDGKFGKALHNGLCTDPLSITKADCLAGGSEWRTGYVEVQPVPALAPREAVTLEAWIRPLERDNTRQTVLRKDGPVSYALEIGGSAEGNAFIFTVGTENGVYSAASSFAAALNSWQYVVGTYDGVFVSLYVNGSLIARSIATGALVQSDAALWIAGTPSGNALLGDIDAVRIESSTLDALQILSRYGITTDQRGQVALWTFDDETGVSVSDRSGNAAVGTLVNNVQRITRGKFGGAVRLDGVNDHILVPASPAFNFFDQMSVSAWFNTANKTSNQRIISSTESGGFQISLNENGICGPNALCFLVWLDFDSGQGGWYYVSAPVSAITANTWHNVVGSYDGEALTLYLDGRQLASFTPTDSTGTPLHGVLGRSRPFTPLCIGEEVGESGCATGTAPFVGELDTIAVYNRALTKAEIQKGSGVVNNSFIRVKTVIGEDTSDFNDNGLKDSGETFTFSNNVYPFLCSLNPGFGSKDTDITLSGFNFGDSNKTFYQNSIYDIGSVVKYDGVAAPTSSISSWSNTAIRSRATLLTDMVPDVGVRVAIAPDSDIYKDVNDNGVYDAGEVFEDRDGDSVFTARELESNELRFRINPVITAVSPDRGPVGQWMTITGYNFGAVPGQVLFFGEISGVVPSVCSSAWTDTQIVIEIPVGVSPDDAGDITVVTAGGLLSNGWPIGITDGEPGPGLCSITPDTTVPFAAVTAVGKNFLDPQGNRGLGALLFSVAPHCSLTQYADQASCETNSGQWVAGQEPGAETDAEWSSTSINSTVPQYAATGNVAVRKRIETGRRCIGFSIGAFCPSGNYEVDYADSISNPVLLTIQTEEAPPESCSSNADCACGGTYSQCINGVCQPLILNVSPDNGAAGDWINIQGCYFGCQEGVVNFTAHPALFSCTDGVSTTKAVCESSRALWSPGRCSTPGFINRIDCEINTGTWTEASCSNPSFVTKEDCEAPRGQWEQTGVDTSGSAFAARGIPPTAEICGTTWTCSQTPGGLDQIITEIPNRSTTTTEDDAITGPIQVVTSFGTQGVSPNDVVINDAPSDAPQICALNPSSGPLGTIVDIRGKNFGETRIVAAETDRVIFHSHPSLVHEPFEDAGLDRIPDAAEPGYDPLTNPDPHGDNYNSGTNPLGTENNGVHDSLDVGTDGLPDTLEPGYDPLTNPDPHDDNWNPLDNPLGTEGDGVAESEFFVDVNNNGAQDTLTPFDVNTAKYVTAAEQVSCPVDDGWEEHKICIAVPDGAVTSNVQVHKNVGGAFIAGTPGVFNVDYTFTTTDGPRVIWTNPTAGSGDFCMNGMPYIAFDRSLQKSSVTNGGVVLESCGGVAITSSTALRQFAKVMQSVAFSLLNLPLPSLAVDCDSATRTQVSAQYSVFTNETGNTFVFIEPLSNLDPSYDYRIRVKGGIQGVKDIFGNPLLVTNDGQDYVVDFSTGSALCEVDYVDVNVYNRPYSGSDPFAAPGNGVVRSEDLFTCTRAEGCRGQFDYDQDSSTPGNQHIYKAIGYAGGGFVCIDRDQTPDRVVSGLTESGCLKQGYEWTEKQESNAVSAVYQWSKPSGSDAAGLISALYSFHCEDGSGSEIFVGSKIACESAGGSWIANDINCNIPQYTSKTVCEGNGGAWFGDDAFQIKNDTGTVFVTPSELVEQGVAQVTVQAQARGSQKTPVQQQFTVHMLQCNNPWPSYDNLFPPEPITNVYNIQTYYCRDGEDPLDPADDLPAAKYFVPDVRNLSLLTNTGFEKGTLENWVVSNGGAFTGQPTTGGICVDGTWHDNMYCRTSGAYSAGIDGNWFVSSYDYYQAKSGQQLGGFRDTIGTLTGWLTSKQFVVEGDELRFRLGGSTAQNVGVRVFVDVNSNGVFDAGADEEICDIRPSAIFSTAAYTCSVAAYKGSAYSDDNGNGVWDIGEFCFDDLVNGTCPGPEKAVVQVYDEAAAVGEYVYFDQLRQFAGGVEQPIRF